MRYSNSDLIHAFPAPLRDDALEVASRLPPASWNTSVSSLRVGSANVSIPYRMYHDPALIDTARLTAQQTVLLDCLLTRHQSGFLRERHLVRIINCDRDWIPPYVVQLVGEYVIEILGVIQKESVNLNARLYRTFLMDNPTFFALTKQRVVSYWNCYHRWQPREDYSGFQILQFFNLLVAENDRPAC
jgi:hypothetical protein